MYRLFFLSCLPFLALLFPLVVAQTCNSTTGTYQSCCPSFDKKTLMFQGREYRVHCDALLGDKPLNGKKARSTSPEDCANFCKNDSPLWTFQSNTRNTLGFCECQEFDTSKTRTISFVPIDSELSKDLDACRQKLSTCTTKPITPCPICPIDTCNQTLQQYQKACPGGIDKCIERVKSCPPKCGDNLNTCERKRKKMCKCPDFPCVTAVRRIGGANFRVHCNERQELYITGQNRLLNAKTSEECAAKCAKSKSCHWASYSMPLWPENTKKSCYLNYDKWHRGRTFTASGPINSLVLEKL